MESGGLWSRLIGELTQGKALTTQLETHMPTEQCKHHAQSLLATFDRALSVARALAEGADRGGEEAAASPRSLSGGPRDEAAGRAIWKEEEPEHGDVWKKRAAPPRWTRKVTVLPGTAAEGPLDDGFSWRKYGQKDILGAKYPRSYYRCGRRHSHGCQATKLVQRSDDNPTVFDVTYQGLHTCNQTEAPAPEGSSAVEAPAELRQPPLQKDVPLLTGYAAGLTVKAEDLDSSSIVSFLPSPSSPSSFSFPSTPGKWPTPATAAVSAAAAAASPFTGSFSISPPLMSARVPFPSTSCSFPAPPFQSGSFGGSRRLPEPDAGEPYGPGAAAAPPAAASAAADMDGRFILEYVEEDSNFRENF